MSTTREAMLEGIRKAVAEGNRAGVTPPLEERGEIAYQGAGPDPAGRFCELLAAAGGIAYRVIDSAEARARVMTLVREKHGRRILLGRGEVLDRLELPNEIQALGAEAIFADASPSEDCRERFFAADLAVSGVDYLIAETGSLVVLARPDQPRSLSLLPPVHIVVATTGQILPDLFDLFGVVKSMPSCLTLITGPSKTGDIELRLVTGVHGPGEVHVVLIDAAARAERRSANGG